MQGLLKLSSDSGPSITLSMPVGQQHSFVADDIPYGAYRVTYHSFSASLTLPAPDDPPILVEISDVPAHALIDFSRSGALRFELYAADGTTYEGPVQVEIRAEGKPSIAPIVNLSSCPCRLVAVEPGEYSIRFGAPFFVDYEASRREVQRVEVVAGQPTTVIAFSPR